MILIRRNFRNFAKHKLLGKYLFLTNTISSAGLMAVGDALQQHIELTKGIRKTESYDWIRTCKENRLGYRQSY